MCYCVSEREREKERERERERKERERGGVTGSLLLTGGVLDLLSPRAVIKREDRDVTGRPILGQISQRFSRW